MPETTMQMTASLEHQFLDHAERVAQSPHPEQMVIQHSFGESDGLARVALVRGNLVGLSGLAARRSTR
jgi:hypothetical protein